MQIRIIGWGCTKTNRTLVNAQAATSEFKEELHVNWVNDLHDVVSHGGFTVPCVLVNGRVKSSGRIPSVYEFTTWIEEELQAAATEDVAA